MRLFARKRSDDEVEVRCPQCREPVPEDATVCVMCGADLRPLLGAAGGRLESRETERPAR